MELARFFLTLIIALLICALLWISLWAYGVSQPLNSYQTELIEFLVESKTKKRLHWEMYSQSQNVRNKNNMGSPSTFLYVSVEDKKGSWWVHRNRDGIPLGGNSNTAKKESLKIESIEDKKEGENLQLLSFLDQNPRTYFFFNIHLNCFSSLKKLKAIVDRGKVWKKIIFSSKSDQILVALKKLAPLWTLGSGAMYPIRYQILSTLALESLISIPGDAVHIDPRSWGQIENLDSLIKWAQKNKKYVLMGPVKKPLPSIRPDTWIVYKREP